MSLHQTTSTSTSYSQDCELSLNSSLVVKTSDGVTSINSNGKQVAQAVVQYGELFREQSGFETSLQITSCEGKGAFAALALYTALRKARIELRTAVFSQEGAVPQDIVDLLGLSPIDRKEVLAGRLDLVLWRLAQVFEKELSIDPMFYVREVADTVQLHVRTAFKQGFFAEVAKKNVSKEQYINVMSQQHAYVKYTTRILGYCVSYGSTSSMRAHFIKHLSEETNHEKIIEADLQHLGADVDYVVNTLEANVPTQQFTLGELALVSHFHDPILLTAAPIAAEGLTAHLDKKFITDLNDLIAGWGIASPERASRFLSSHIDFDSGDDGHFEGTMKMLADHLVDERSVRRFVSALHAQMESFLRIYELGMEETTLWSPS